MNTTRFFPSAFFFLFLCFSPVPPTPHVPTALALRVQRSGFVGRSRDREMTMPTVVRRLTVLYTLDHRVDGSALGTVGEKKRLSSRSLHCLY